MNKNCYDYMSIVYDSLTEDIDYDEWYQYTTNCFNTLIKKPVSILEIGAGTGNMTEHFVKDAYQVTALEPSLAMLSVLQEKCTPYMSRIKFYHGTLRTFNTSKTYDAVVGFLDILNYIPPDQLNLFFERLHALLGTGGIALFDYSTPYKLKHIIGDSSFAETHEDFAFIWENYYNNKDEKLEFDFTLFTENSEGKYDRSLECHTQYAHNIKRLKQAFGNKFELIKHVGDDYASLKNKDNRRHIFLRKL